MFLFFSSRLGGESPERFEEAERDQRPVALEPARHARAGRAETEHDRVGRLQRPPAGAQVVAKGAKDDSRRTRQSGQ